MTFFPIGNLFIDDILSSGIVKPGTRLDNGSTIPYIVLLGFPFIATLFAQRSIHIHPPDTAECQPLYIFIQTACNLAQRTGQHGNNIIDQIHRGGPTQSLLIHGTFGGYKMRYIGNMHANFNPSVRQRRNVQRIVQILGSRRVNGKNTMVAIITSSTTHVLSRLPPHFTILIIEESSRLYRLLHIAQYRRREFSMIESILHEQCFRLVLHVAGAAKTCDVCARWPFIRCMPRSMGVLCTVQSLCGIGGTVITITIIVFFFSCSQCTHEARERFVVGNQKIPSSCSSSSSLVGKFGQCSHNRTFWGDLFIVSMIAFVLGVEFGRLLSGT
mmetsp:Transcript_2535/g.5400  ORF Transcript_2535/g.5400 Transcript_2535/m.5400 type:complete len:328 (+) Transcript_2535:1236-2219(+)